VTGTNVPKPADQRRRRNVVPASASERRLPLAGRTGLAPDPPAPLGEAGMRWWMWAWSTPQATTWNHDGFTMALYRRAELEDLWTDGGNQYMDPLKLIPIMGRLDEQFGLTPRSAAQLHLSFAEPEEAAPAPPGSVTDIRNRLKGLG
jgi:hypothetical protein